MDFFSSVHSVLLIAKSSKMEWTSKAQEFHFIGSSSATPYIQKSDFHDDWWPNSCVYSEILWILANITTCSQQCVYNFPNLGGFHWRTATTWMAGWVRNFHFNGYLKLFEIKILIFAWLLLHSGKCDQLNCHPPPPATKLESFHQGSCNHHYSWLQEKKLQMYSWAHIAITTMVANFFVACPHKTVSEER